MWTRRFHRRLPIGCLGQRAQVSVSPVLPSPGAGPLAADAATGRSDDLMLDRLQHAAFNYFLKMSNPANGLVADTTRQGSPASIAVIGFALSAYPVAVERGWMARADAVQRTLAALRFFRDSDQTGSPVATGYHGFYFHFLDMHSGARMWQSELSLIDSALLLAGMLTAATYFTAATPAEVELRELADVLYRRVDWAWAQRDGPCRQVHPARADDLEVGKIGLPHLVWSCRLVGKLGCRLDDDEGRAGDQIMRLQQTVNRCLGYEVTPLVSEANRHLAR